MQEKTRDRFLAVLVLLSVGFSVVMALYPRTRARVQERITAAITTETAPVKPRAGITFILGEDHGANRYYTRAAYYYRTDPVDRTEQVVTECRSLLAARNYLAAHPPHNGEPWGLINLVIHGNEWTGFAAPVLPGGDSQTTAAVLTSVLAAGTFPPSPDTVIDDRSEIILHGCAIGRNGDILRLTGRLFASERNIPIVRSCRYFLLFDADEHNGEPVRVRRFMAKFWYAFFPHGFRPGDIRLARQLARRYPDETVNWRDALSRTAPRWPGDAFQRTFAIPLEWTATYPDTASRPDVRPRAAQQGWLRAQPALQEYLAACGMSTDDFIWTFAATDYPDAAGANLPAIRATGRCSIVSVLQALLAPATAGATAQPLRAAVADEQYYCTVAPARQ